MMRPEMYSVAGLETGRLSIMARPRGGDWLADEVKALRESGVDVLVSLLTAEEVAELDLAREEQWCRTHGVSYLSLPITDRGLPHSYRQTVDLLTGLADRRAEGKQIAIHCRQGVGRSSLMAASLLTMRGMAAPQAFELLATARGRPVPDTEEQRAWVVAFAERIADRERYRG